MSGMPTATCLAPDQSKVSAAKKGSRKERPPVLGQPCLVTSSTGRSLIPVRAMGPGEGWAPCLGTQSQLQMRRED